MRYIELRRHTMRVKPGQHLSQAGVDLARRIGGTIGPFNRVITSTIPRAYETAIAMGFAVDEEFELLSKIPDGVEEEVGGWDVGFATWSDKAKNGSKAVRYFVQAQWAILLNIALGLPEESAALVISHGGIVEAQTVGSLPNVDFSGWGGGCDYCEGARLHFEGKQFIKGEVLRISK